jgi:hypothetical protein
MSGERCLVERRNLIGLRMAGVCEIHDVVFAATDLEGHGEEAAEHLRERSDRP